MKISCRLLTVWLFMQLIVPVSFAKDTPHGSNKTQNPSEAFAPERPKCPGVLERLVDSEDKKGGVLGFLTGGITVAGCTDSIVNPSLLPSPEALESSFHSYLSSSLGDLPPDFINRCLREKNNQPRLKKFSDDQKRAIISDYYWSAVRLSEQSKANLEAMAAIDLTLGRSGSEILKRSLPSAKKNRSLSSPLLPGSRDVEKKLTECRPVKINPSSGNTETMDQMITQTQNALAGIAKINEEQRDLSKKSRRGIPQSKTQALENARELILNSAPWLRGTEGKKLLTSLSKSPQLILSSNPEARSTIASRLKAQLLANRKGIETQMVAINRASDCLHARGAKFECVNEQRMVFDQLPRFSPKERIISSRLSPGQSEDSLSREEQARLIHSRTYMSSAQCRYDQRGNKKAVQEDSRELAINVGITVTSAGLGSILSAGKLAVSAGRAAQLSRSAQLARAALIGYDAVLFTDGASAAYKACDQALEGSLSENPQQRTTSSSPPLPPSDEPSCHGGSDQVQLVTNLKECYVQAALAGVGLIAAVPGNIALFRGMRTPTDRLRALGFDDKATQEIVEGLAKSERTPFNLSRWARNVPDKNLLVLDTLEELGPNFARNIKTASHRQALGETLGEMQRYFGNEWKPARVARFMESIAGSGEEGLRTLSRAFSDADELLKKTPSLGQMGALKAYLEKLKMNETDSQQLLSCLGSAFK